MRGGHARRQIGKERRDLGGDREPRISPADAAQIFLARLLHDGEARLQAGIEPADRSRHDVGHDARALTAAGDEDAQRIGGRRVGHVAAAMHRGRSGLPVSVAFAASCGALANMSGNFVAIAVTRGARRRLARPITALES